MARPITPGLVYYPSDVDYFEDFKIMDLMDEYGPLGSAIYQAVLCLSYKEGYYLAVPIDKLSQKIVRMIGNKWAKNKQVVKQVIYYCADIGLLDKDLLNQNIITSVGIQKRYAKATERRQPYDSRYRLIDEDGQPLILTPQNKVIATENIVNVTETQVNVCSNPTKEKESKEEKSKENNNKAVVVFGSNNIFHYVEQFFGILSPSSISEIKGFLEDGVSEDVIKRAIDISVDNGVPKWSYCRSILNTWRESFRESVLVALC